MKNPFELEQLTHLALVQYYRWYQVYEVPFTAQRIENQKDILSEDVEIITQMGTAKGKDGIEDRLKVYTGWLNAHHVQQTKVEILDKGLLSLEADIVYQNIRPDDSRFSYTIHYSTLLQMRENDLPVFTQLELKPTGEIAEFQFKNAYPENRCKSFMHYWLYLSETPTGDSNRYKEILADGFQLHFSSGLIDTFEKLEQWLQNAGKQVKTTTHSYKNFKVIDNNDNTFSVTVDFDWKGITFNDKNMIAETHHEWILENNMDDRFAKLKTLNVTLIKPFQIV